MILDCNINSKGKLIESGFRSLKLRIRKFFSDALKHILKEDKYVIGKDEWEDIKKWNK